MTSRSTEYIPYAGSTSKKFFLGLELPNEVSLASKRPLVTPKKCGSHKNDRDPPWSYRPSSVFFVPGGILPVCLHIEGGSSARSLHWRRYHLGLKIQVDFKGEWSRARFLVRRLAIFRERVTALPKTQVQSLHTLHDRDFVNRTHKTTTSRVPQWRRHIMSSLHAKILTNPRFER